MQLLKQFMSMVSLIQMKNDETKHHSVSYVAIFFGGSKGVYYVAFLLQVAHSAALLSPIFEVFMQNWCQGKPPPSVVIQTTPWIASNTLSLSR